MNNFEIKPNDIKLYLGLYENIEVIKTSKISFCMQLGAFSFDTKTFKAPCVVRGVLYLTEDQYLENITLKGFE